MLFFSPLLFCFEQYHFPSAYTQFFVETMKEECALSYTDDILLC